MSSLGAFVGAFADSTPGGSVLDLGGVTAGFVPAMWERRKPA